MADERTAYPAWMRGADDAALRSAWDILQRAQAERCGETDPAQGRLEEIAAQVAEDRTGPVTERQIVHARRDAVTARQHGDGHWHTVLADHVVQLAAGVERLRAERDEMAARLDAAWTVVREGTANNRALLATVRAERDEAREQVKRVRTRHVGQCGGFCAAEPCECGDDDLLCAECETPHPCPTVLDLDGKTGRDS